MAKITLLEQDITEVSAVDAGYAAIVPGDDGKLYTKRLSTAVEIPTLTTVDDAIEAATGNQWAGKRIACLGTSITAGSYWRPVFNTLIGQDTTNLGVSGGSLSSSAGSQPAAIYNQIANIPSDAELVLIECGINDFRTNATLGTIADTTLATFYGALDKTIADVIALNTARPVCFLLPYGNTDTNYAGTWNTNNNNGVALSAFRNAIIEKCEQAGVPYIDPARAGIGGRTASLYLGDGIHPNTAGSNRYANYVYEQLREIPVASTTVPSGWNMRIATQADVSGYNTTATYSSSSNGSVTNSGPAVGSWGVAWLASGSNNAAEWAGGGWIFMGDGTSGCCGIGDAAGGTFSTSGRLASGVLTTAAITGVNVTVGATKRRAARVGNLFYYEEEVGGNWIRRIDGVDITTYGAAIAGFRETIKIGVLHNGSVTNYRTGVFTP